MKNLVKGVIRKAAHAAIEDNSNGYEYCGNHSLYFP